MANKFDDDGEIIPCLHDGDIRCDECGDLFADGMMVVGRCSTCKHWQNRLRLQVGVCEMSDASKFASSGDDAIMATTPIQTGPGFGCVLWEKKR